MMSRSMQHSPYSETCCGGKQLDVGWAAYTEQQRGGAAAADASARRTAGRLLRLGAGKQVCFEPPHGPLDFV
jgi:hypothetical protein